MLCYMAAALRQQASAASDRRQKLLRIRESFELCKRATQIDDCYAFGWYSLGNTLLLRFFATCQFDKRDLVRFSSFFILHLLNFFILVERSRML